MIDTNTILLIDAGNTRIKWALCHNGQLDVIDPLVYQETTLTQQLTNTWNNIQEQGLVPTKFFLSNVAGQQMLDALNQWVDRDIIVKEAGGLSIQNIVAQASAYGVTNAYQKPELLGADRWAALVAARHYLKGDACIIDCGTTMTIDILTGEGKHMGGIIVPGWEMMQTSLVTNTQGITSSDGEVPDLLGISTQQAVQAGISAASIGAVKHILQRYENDMDTVFTCIVTGGAAGLVLSQLKSVKYNGSFQYEPDWVLKGLAVLSNNPLNESLTHDSGVL